MRSENLRLARAVAFLSAALLFALQLLTAREYLAVFGGSFAIWGVLTAGFQVLLLFSYAVAPSLLRQGHLGRIFATLGVLVWLRIWIGAADEPSSWLWASLFLRVAPFAFALGLTSVALEHLFSSSEVSDLYGYSNRGSIAGLALYALALEPWTSLSVQRIAFALLFTVLAALWWRILRRNGFAALDDASVETREMWVHAATVAFVGSFLASALTLSTTQLLTLDVGNFPLIWAIPLAILLMAFAQAFGSAHWPRWLSERLLWISLGFGLVFFLGAANVHTHLQLWVECAVLWVFANSLLSRVRDARPDHPRGLTRYFVALAAGGACGSTMVGFAMPLLSDRLVEYPALLIVSALLLQFYAKESARPAHTAPRPARTTWLSFLLFAATLFAVVWIVSRGRGTLVSVAHARSHYGTYRVTERRVSGSSVRELIFGTTQHGREDLAQPGVPQSYFHAHGPLSAIWGLTPASRRNVAIVGLGVGAIAAYSDEQDAITYFELDPQMETLARSHFGFLSRAQGQVSVVIGDARARLREAPPHSLDLLLIDAFSGDSIPLHLLTVGAMREYVTRLKPSGVLAFHVSNRYFRLAPFVSSAASSIDWIAFYAHKTEDLADGEDPAEYVVVLPRARADALRYTAFVAISSAGTAPFHDDHAQWLLALR